MTSLDTMLERAKEQARALARDAEHMPLLMLLRGGHVDVVGLAGVAPAEVLPRLLARAQPDAYVLVVEGRTKQIHPEDQGLYRKGQIADDRRNPSILTIFAAPRGGPVRLVVAQCLKESFPREFESWREPDKVGGRVAIADW